MINDTSEAHIIEYGKTLTNITTNYSINLSYERRFNSSILHPLIN